MKQSHVQLLSQTALISTAYHSVQSKKWMFVFLVITIDNLHSSHCTGGRTRRKFLFVWFIILSLDQSDPGQFSAVLMIFVYIRSGYTSNKDHHQANTMSHLQSYPDLNHGGLGSPAWRSEMSWMPVLSLEWEWDRKVIRRAGVHDKLFKDLHNNIIISNSHSPPPSS